MKRSNKMVLFVLIMATVALLINGIFGKRSEQAKTELIVPESPELEALLNTEARSVASLEPKVQEPVKINETEQALNRFGLSLSNSVKVSVK